MVLLLPIYNTFSFQSKLLTVSSPSVITDQDVLLLPIYNAFSWIKAVSWYLHLQTISLTSTIYNKTFSYDQSWLLVSTNFTFLVSPQQSSFCRSNPWIIIEFRSLTNICKARWVGGIFYCSLFSSNENIWLLTNLAPVEMLTRSSIFLLFFWSCSRRGLEVKSCVKCLNIKSLIIQLSYLSLLEHSLNFYSLRLWTLPKRTCE